MLYIYFFLLMQEGIELDFCWGRNSEFWSFRVLIFDDGIPVLLIILTKVILKVWLVTRFFIYPSFEKVSILWNTRSMTP